MSNFDRNHPHGHLSDGCPAEIVKRDFVGDDGCTILAVVTLPGGKQTIRTFHPDGSWNRGESSHFNLINAPAPKWKFWVNVYAPPNFSHAYISRELADEAANPARIACIEVMEGDGL